MSERHLTCTAVFVILEQEDGKVFFLRRANTGWADGLLTVPAGHVDKGDTIRQAAVKEVREEAGVEVKEEDLEFVHVDYQRDRYVDFYFKARTWEGTPYVGEPNLSSEALWIEKDNLPDDVIPQLKNMFTQIEKQVFFSDVEREV